MKFKKCLLPVAMLASFTLAGCQSNADDHAADVYQTDQLNTKQETKTVNIISILPAKVAVDNSQNKRNAQAFGALIGAVAGGVIGHNVGSGSNSGTTAGAVGGGAVWICPYISRHLLSLNPLQARCRRYSRGER